MNRASWTAPFPDDPVKLVFPDVEPDELAREEAREDGPWPLYLRRVLAREPGPEKAPAGD